MENALRTPRAGSTARFIASFGLIFLFFSFDCGACELPQNISANYVIQKYNATIARATLSVQQDNKSLIYQSQTRAAGLLIAFNNDELNEISKLVQLDNNSWQLKSFQQQRKKEPYRHQTFTLEWNDNQAQIEGISDNKEFRLTAQGSTWDRSSVQIAIMCALAANKNETSFNYQVIESGELIRYVFNRSPDEKFVIAGETYDAILLERTHGKRKTKLWLSPQLNYLPIKMEQYKNGDLNLRMLFDNLKKKS